MEYPWEMSRQFYKDIAEMKNEILPLLRTNRSISASIIMLLKLFIRAGKLINLLYSVNVLPRVISNQLVVIRLMEYVQ